MAECLISSNTSLATRCAGRGELCLFTETPVVSFNCTCQPGYTGFGDFNPLFDNCDVYLPIIYVSGALIILTAIGILYIVYWAVSQRTPSKFVQLLRRRNAPALIAVSAFIVGLCQILWVGLRLSDIEKRAIGVDLPTTLTFGISLFFIYVTAPHVLRHYAKLTFSESRVRMLNSVGREKAKFRAKVARPLVLFFLPLFSAIAGFSPLISVNDPSKVKVGLQIMAVSTAIFLLLTLILIALLITPMVRDMVLAVSMKRLTASEQELLVNATKKLVFFQYLIVSASVSYIPIMLICGFYVPEMNGIVTYFFFIGAEVCGCISGLSVYTLTNITKTNRFSLFSKRKQMGGPRVENDGVVVDMGKEILIADNRDMSTGTAVPPPTIPLDT